jgi:hypothetical protein
MKKLIQNAIRPLLMVVALLAFGISANGWNSYSLVEYNGSRNYNLTWNGSCYSGKIPAGQKGLNFNVKASDDKAEQFYGYGRKAEFQVKFNGSEQEQDIYEEDFALILDTDNELNVEVYVQDGNQGWNPVKIKVYPVSVSVSNIYLAGDPLDGFEGMVSGWDNATNYISVNQVIKINPSERERSFAFKNDDKKQFGPDGSASIADGEFTAKYNTNSIFTVPAYKGYELTIVSCSESQVVFTAKLTEKMEQPRKDYYFIGDLNQWFSKAFTKNDDGTYGTNYDENGNETSAGIDYTFLTKGYGNIPGRDSWKFKYDENDGWYKFSDFPDGMLAGQFQIFDGNSWAGGGTYCHKVAVRRDNDNLSDEARQAKFKEYIADCVPVDENGTEYEVSHSEGQNIHLPCNAVKEAQIWFNPDLNGKPVIMVLGKKVDYYIFYDRTGDRDHEQLRAHINSEKPNANNYYIPFNKVEYGNNNSFTASNINDDKNHMNYTEGTDFNANGYKMERKSFGEIEGLTSEEINAWLPNADEQLVTDLTAGKLSNGVEISGRNIWYAKVPNGFACPAGTKFAVAFRNSADENSYREEDGVKYPYWTPLGLQNLYFFDGIHMHVNTEDFANVCDVKVEYRVYTYDRNYNVVALDAEDNNTIHPISKTSNDEKGWVELTTEHYNHSMWGVEAMDVYGKNNWRIKKEAEAAAANDAQLKRKEIPAGLSNAYVQFRFTYSPKAGTSTAARAASFNPYSVYVPALPTVGDDSNEIKLKGTDHYYVLENGVATGVEEIFGSESSDFETVAPVYYNLQGVRVENPTNGLYIKVTGSKSEKVLF